MTHITPFLMFTGQAKQALALYAKCFDDFSVVQMDEYPDDNPQLKGKVHYAIINILGQHLAVIDSPIEHAFGFTPALSLMVEFEHLNDIESTYRKLTRNGEILMPLDQYDFAQKYAWINDVFGVSWQLKLS